MTAVGEEYLDAVCVLSFDDGARNVLDPDSVAALRDALARAESKPEVGALVLHGRPGCFCAGLDLRVLGAGDPVASELLLAMGELLLSLYGSRLRVVAGCTGHAVAAGAMLLLASEVRLGVDGEFRLGFTELSRGMPLPALPIELARQRLDRRHFEAATLQGRLYAPGEAVGAGFLDRLVPPEDLRAGALEAAAALAALDGAAYEATLRGVRGASLARMEEIVASVRRHVAGLR